MSAVQQRQVSSDEEGMRLDRWFAHHFPQLGFGRLQKLIRNGQVKVDKAKVKTNTRLAAGQTVRIPPIDDPGNASNRSRSATSDADFLRDLILYEDDDIYVFNKPHGLAVQGGSGTKRHIDGMLKSLPNKKGEAPRLVHRLDRDTSGVSSSPRPRPPPPISARCSARARRGRFTGPSSPAIRIRSRAKSPASLPSRRPRMASRWSWSRTARPAPSTRSSYYSTTDTASRRFAWVTLKPVTGRTHQLRVHMAQLGTPIIGDPRYFNIENWQGAPGLGEGLHLHARRIALPLRSGKRLDVSRAAAAAYAGRVSTRWALMPTATMFRWQDPEDDA